MKLKSVRLGNSVKVGNNVESTYLHCTTHNVDLSIEDKLFIKIRDRRSGDEVLTSIMNMIFCVEDKEVKPDEPKTAPAKRTVVKLSGASTTRDSAGVSKASAGA